MTLKYIWFDLGYTLVYSKREKIFQDILVSMNKHIDINKIKMAYHLTDKFFMREHKGLLCKSKEEFMPYYLKKLLEVLNIKVDRNILLHEINKREQKYQKIWYTYDSAVSVLTTLKQNSIRSGIISNWDNTSRKVLCQNNLDDLLDEIVISSEVGYSKPQKEIFDFALKRANVEPDECLFVGDNYYDDIVGSSKVNMKSLLINPYGKVGIEELNYAYIISNISELPKFIERNYNLKLF